MKKILFALVVFATMLFASCAGNKTTEGTQEAITEAETQAEELTAQLDQVLNAETIDSETAKTLLEQVEAKIAELQAAGQAEAAAAYASKVKTYLEKNAETITEILPESSTVIETVSAAAELPENVKDAASEVVDAAEDAVKETVEEAVEDTKEAAEAKKEAAVESAKAAADEAIESGVSKASDAVSKGLQNLGK